MLGRAVHYPCPAPASSLEGRARSAESGIRDVRRSRPCRPRAPLTRRSSQSGPTLLPVRWGRKVAPVLRELLGHLDEASPSLAQAHSRSTPRLPSIPTANVRAPILCTSLPLPRTGLPSAVAADHRRRETGCRELWRAPRCRSGRAEARRAEPEPEKTAQRRRWMEPRRGRCKRGSCSALQNVASSRRFSAFADRSWHTVEVIVI